MTQGSAVVRVADLDVAVRVEGPAHAPAVLLVHGVLATHSIWDGVAERFAGDWRVVRYDLRGHGGSAAGVPPYSMALLARDAVGLLDALGLRRVHFIGCSLGGMIGQRVAAEHGDRLLPLTLANTSAVQSAPQAWAERAALAAEKGIAALVEPTLQRWFTASCFERNPALIERVRREALRTRVDGFVGCAVALRDLAQRELLPAIAVPTLVLAGEHDLATPVGDARALHEAIAQAQLRVLPAAHQAAAECPEEFSAAWTEFQARIR